MHLVKSLTAMRIFGERRSGSDDQRNIDLGFVLIGTYHRRNFEEG